LEEILAQEEAEESAGMNRPLIHFTRGKSRFKIYKEGRLYVGYVNGVRSVTGRRKELAMRTLLKKHIEGKPSADVIDLRAARSILGRQARAN
jgi:hypothetical protein